MCLQKLIRAGEKKKSCVFSVLDVTGCKEGPLPRGGHCPCDLNCLLSPVRSCSCSPSGLCLFLGNFLAAYFPRARCSVQGTGRFALNAQYFKRLQNAWGGSSCVWQWLRCWRRSIVFLFRKVLISRSDLSATFCQPVVVFVLFQPLSTTSACWRQSLQNTELSC